MATWLSPTARYTLLLELGWRAVNFRVPGDKLKRQDHWLCSMLASQLPRNGTAVPNLREGKEGDTPQATPTLLFCRIKKGFTFHQGKYTKLSGFSPWEFHIHIHTHTQMKTKTETNNHLIALISIFSQAEAGYNNYSSLPQWDYF